MINSTFNQIFVDNINRMFGTDGLSRPCKLVSENRKKTQCPNCIIDPISGKSSGRYKTGGDINFPYGQLCPVCNGVGFLRNKSEHTIDLLVIYEYKKFINFNTNLNIPDGTIQIIAKFSDLSKLQRANTLIVDTSVTYIPNNEYEPLSQPQPIGLGKNDYLFMYWKTT